LKLSPGTDSGSHSPDREDVLASGQVSQSGVKPCHN
jgi:hypothetical protein